MNAFLLWAHVRQHQPRCRALLVHVDDMNQLVDVQVRRYVPGRMNWAYANYRFTSQFRYALQWRSILAAEIRALRREVRSVR